MVRRAAATEWGRKHGFAAIREVKDYQRAVPIQTYEDLAPLWHRAFDGDRDVTWPGHIPYFSLTSGTTMGASKAMPVTRDALRVGRRSGMTLLARMSSLDPATDYLDGKVLYFGLCDHGPDYDPDKVARMDVRRSYYGLLEEIAGEMGGVHYVDIGPGVAAKAHALREQNELHTIYGDTGHLNAVGNMIVAGEMLRVFGVVSPAIGEA